MMGMLASGVKAGLGVGVGVGVGAGVGVGVGEAGAGVGLGVGVGVGVGTGVGAGVGVGVGAKVGVAAAIGVGAGVGVGVGAGPQLATTKTATPRTMPRNLGSLPKFISATPPPPLALGPIRAILLQAERWRIVTHRVGNHDMKVNLWADPVGTPQVAGVGTQFTTSIGRIN